MMQKGQVAIAGLFILVVLGFAGVFYYALNQYSNIFQNSPTVLDTPEPTFTPSPTPAADETTTWSIETLASGDSLSINGNHLINNPEEWKRLWNKISPEKKMPAVDFFKETVIVASVKGTSNGYEVEILGINKLNNNIEISIKETSPGSGCATLPVITAPYQIVKTSKINGETTFKITKEAKDYCKR